MSEIGIPQSSPPELFCDILSAVYLSATSAMHERSKHFEVDFHFVREKVAFRKLIVHHILSEYQLADIFTKSLPTRSFQDLRFKLGVVCSRTQSLRGRVDRTDKTMKVWKAKENTGSETCSVSETEKNISMGLRESDKVQRAETSFTKNEVGLQKTEHKSTQEHGTTTATSSQEIKNRQRTEQVVLHRTPWNNQWH